MDRYQIAEHPNGPWLELQVTNNPNHALQLARASFPDWDYVYVAKMRPVTGQDILPSEEILHGDIMEGVITKHGSQMADQLHDEIDMSRLWKDLCNATTGHLLDVESGAMVAGQIKRYGKNDSASPYHFENKVKLEI